MPNTCFVCGKMSGFMKFGDSIIQGGHVLCPNCYGQIEIPVNKMRNTTDPDIRSRRRSLQRAAYMNVPGQMPFIRADTGYTFIGMILPGRK